MFLSRLRATNAASVPRACLVPYFQMCGRDSARYRHSGCVVSPMKLKKTFEKQFTKMGAYRHGINYMVPTCGMQNPIEVNLKIRKKKGRNMHIDERRSVTLASTIFPYICDMVTSGELGEEFSGLKITLTRLEVVRDFSALRIFWYSETDDTTIDEEMQMKLHHLGASLREALAITSVLPSIPPIVFAMDKPEQERSRLIRTLESVDFGPDYVRSESSLQSEHVESAPKAEDVPKWFKKKKAKSKASETFDNPVT